MTLAAIVIRWCGLGAVAGVIGGCAIDVLVRLDGADTADVRRRTLRWSLGCVGVLAVTTVGELVLRAGTLVGGSLARAISALPVVLSRTHFGSVWLARAAAVVVLGALLLSGGRRARVAALAVSAGVALSTALLGHAADAGDLTLGVLFDWIHILAGSVWIGGLAVLTLVVAPAAGSRCIPTMARFSRLVAWALAAIVLTGVWNAWVQVRDATALIDTAYGRTLLLKVALVGVLIALGATNRYTLLPRLTRIPARSVVAGVFRRCRFVVFGRTRPSPERLFAVMTSEALFGVAVLALTAVLGESTPARHAGHLMHPADVEARGAPIRATMEQLHAAGGIPRGWRFRLPAGDPGRGREVFANLECFRCHRLRGESFPAPSEAGPDLTGVGFHHPASYIAESVLNPNAVIVEGPGYTGLDGRSTMPDYRTGLTVADLLDLVAFLTTQDR